MIDEDGEEKDVPLDSEDFKALQERLGIQAGVRFTALLPAEGDNDVRLGFTALLPSHTVAQIAQRLREFLRLMGYADADIQTGLGADVPGDSTALATKTASHNISTGDTREVTTAANSGGKKVLLSPGTETIH